MIDTCAGWALFTCALAWILSDRLGAALAWLDRHNAETDAQTAADHNEPSRAQVEWELHIAEAIRLTREDEAADAEWAALPIYSATAAHIARQAAETLDDEWADMNGGRSA